MVARTNVEGTLLLSLREVRSLLWNTSSVALSRLSDVHWSTLRSERPGAVTWHWPGQATVETALLIPVGLLALLGIIDFGRVYFIARS